MGFARRSGAESSVRRNPFGAASTDDQNRVARLGEERAEAIEPQIGPNSRADLADSHSRLSAELAWFPGASATRPFATADGLNAGLSEPSPDLPLLARTNLLAARIGGLDVPERDAVRNLLELAAASEGINAETVMRDINHSRSLASIPLADDMHLLLSELAARRRFYRDVAWRFLNGLSTRTLVQLLTELAARSTDGAQKRASSLVEELVKDYEVAARGFIEGESYNVKKLVALIRLRIARNEPDVGGLIRALNASLANWSFVTKPIQLVDRSQRRDHPATHRLANHVRSLAIELRSQSALSTAADEIMRCLRTEFALLSEFYDQITNETSTIIQVTKDREENRLQTASHSDEYETSLSYSVNVGRILKRRLEISAVGLSWEGRSYKFEEINRLRWGHLKYSVSGLATGAKYGICFQTSNLGAVIHTRDADIYNAIVDRLWRTVAVRILFEYVERLKSGGKLIFPRASVEDIAITLPIKSAFKAKKRVRVTWNNVRLWSSDRFLVIGMKGDNRVVAAMSYANTDNLRVLEHLLGLVLTSRKSSVSEILH
jgi:hypothetical protein